MTWAERQRRLDGYSLNFGPGGSRNRSTIRGRHGRGRARLAADLQFSTMTRPKTSIGTETPRSPMSVAICPEAAVAALRKSPAPPAPPPDPGRFWDWGDSGAQADFRSRPSPPPRAERSAAGRSACGARPPGAAPGLALAASHLRRSWTANPCAEGEAPGPTGRVDQRLSLPTPCARRISSGPASIVALHARGTSIVTRWWQASSRCRGLRHRALLLSPGCGKDPSAPVHGVLAAPPYDDLRLAVTETVTASPCLTWERDRGMA